MLLVFLLFIIAQFLYFDQIFVLEQLRLRQQHVHDAIVASLDESDRPDVEVVSVDDYHQRITFPATLLFEPCRSNVQPRGQAVVRQVGAAIEPFAPYFESLQVEGHTDILPPTNCVDVDDNWALSSERATAVVRLLADSVAFGRPELLSAVGRSQFQPAGGIVPLTFDPDSLAAHRRIEMVLQYTDAGIRDTVR